MTAFTPGSSATWGWCFLKDLTWALFGAQNQRPAPAATHQPAPWPMANHAPKFHTLISRPLHNMPQSPSCWGFTGTTLQALENRLAQGIKR